MDVCENEEEGVRIRRLSGNGHHKAVAVSPFIHMEGTRTHVQTSFLPHLDIFSIPGLRGDHLGRFNIDGEPSEGDKTSLVQIKATFRRVPFG